MLLYEQSLSAELRGMPVGTVRGQYGEPYARLLFAAADEFPNIEVRQVAAAGQECFAHGGHFTVPEGHMALDIIGYSDEEHNGPLSSFWKRVKELEEDQQINQE